MSHLTPPSVRRAQRPPRINLRNLQTPNNGSVVVSMSPTGQPQTPFSVHTNTTVPGSQVAGQPYWPEYSNPFAAGGFMVKGFEELVDFTKSGMSFGEKFTYGLYDKFSKWSKKWFTHMFLMFVVILYTVGGALLFGAIEGRQAEREANEAHALQKQFFRTLRELSSNQELIKNHPEEFDGKVINTLRNNLAAVETFIYNDLTLEELNKKKKPWSFWNAMFFCGTIYTTIGYGHITPHTPLGQSLTIVYAIIGIPMFLILLADFGKLFTRGMKFIWAYVRRLYYTGTCRNIRKQQQVRDAMTGFNTVYDMAIRRPSQFFGMGPESDIESEPGKSIGASHPDTPTSPYPETFEIDDEFNLPVSLASILLISYILIGALMYHLWEEWTYFEAFYFVFISMSTIGFGDLVPNHPIFMMCTMIYLVFGLALTSMFINVVQIKLSDTFKQASDKLGATIGFGLASELGDDGGSQLRLPSELASVHGSRLGKISEHGTDPATAASSPMPGPQLQSILRAARPVSPLVHVNRPNDGSDPEHAPPLLPRRQVSMEPKGNDREKKKKRRFFK